MLTSMKPADLAQAQLDAYNAHDIKVFVACYHPDVEVRDFPSGALRLQGRTEMHTRYAPLFENTNLHADVVQRIEQDNIVIDEERVRGLGEDLVAATAIYEVEGETIRRVWFVRAR